MFNSALLKRMVRFLYDGFMNLWKCHIFMLRNPFSFLLAWNFCLLTKSNWVLFLHQRNFKESACFFNSGEMHTTQSAILKCTAQWCFATAMALCSHYFCLVSQFCHPHRTPRPHLVIAPTPFCCFLPSSLAFCCYERSRSRHITQKDSHTRCLLCPFSFT